jgi:glycosyltransferase involved in cell wall biosynthesis
VLFIQDGSRRRYAVPLALQRAGMLQQVATDWYSAPHTWQQRVAGILSRCKPDLGRRMAGRHHPDLDPRRVASHPWITLARMLGERGPAGHARAAQRMTRFVLRRRLLDHANVLMGFVRNLDPALLRAAQERGLLTVGDQIIAPAAVERDLLLQQRQRFPDYETPDPGEDHAAIEAIERQSWSALHVVTVMSPFVRDALVAQGVPASRIALIEYPFDAAGFDVPDRRGRRTLTVGFVGAINLRKGGPYFLQVAQRLASPSVRFVMVGAIGMRDRAVREHSARVEFTGPVPRAAVLDQLRRFDVLLFPSTCEGSAGAVMEAMAAGLPVITTPNAGSVARDGVEGFILPHDDVDALTHRLDDLLRDEPTRLAMGRAAAARAREFTVERYQRQLADTLAAALAHHAEGAA